MINADLKVDQFLDWWQSNPENAEQIAAFQKSRLSTGNLRPFPQEMDLRLAEALNASEIIQLYSHQSQSFAKIREGRNIVVSTGTASGKTLCYNLPVLDAILKNSTTRAIYVFPTKALGHDQLTSLENLINAIRQEDVERDPILASAYDGDTPSTIRAAIRSKSQILLTNPDMLHLAILPHHTIWAEFFRSLRYVVIDEMHLYRGVFGSNVANVIRRLKRIAHFYQAYPQFILTSATIANSKDLAENLIEEKCVLIDEDGSPHGNKTFFLYNPPIIHEELGIRKSVTQETIRIAGDFLNSDIQSIVFTRTRRGVELFVKKMREANSAKVDEIQGYRSGYLPKQRRLLESNLRNGEIKTIFATNALELGIDIGGMDCVILAGYPGTIASTRQQAGRSGRRLGSSAAILIASANPLDQYLINHPDFLFNRNPEKAYINPNNLLILLEHLRCAVFELPFEKPYRFGKLLDSEINFFLQVLADSGEIFQKADRYYWVSDQYPSSKNTLRSTNGQNVILEATDEDGRSKVIGQVDEPSSYWMVHPDAIYLQEGQTYQVDHFDFKQRRVSLKNVNVDFYTTPIQKSDVTLENLLKNEQKPLFSANLGEVLVTGQVTGYKKLLWETNEIIDMQELEMPVSELHTVGAWFTLSQALENQMKKLGAWTSSKNDYGKNWESIRNEIRARDQFTCQVCGKLENGVSHHVHHKLPFKGFVDASLANKRDNLITLCYSCHQKAEAAIQIKSGLAGLAYTMQQLAPIFTMCDAKDLGLVWDVKLKLGEGRPTIVLYDQVPAGIGLCSQIYEDHLELLKGCYDLVSQCKCKDGCPSCVGPSGSAEVGGKQETMLLLNLLLKKEGTE